MWTKPMSSYQSVCSTVIISVSHDGSAQHVTKSGTCWGCVCVHAVAQALHPLHCHVFNPLCFTVRLSNNRVWYTALHAESTCCRYVIFDVLASSLSREISLIIPMVRDNMCKECNIHISSDHIQKGKWIHASVEYTYTFIFCWPLPHHIRNNVLWWWRVMSNTSRNFPYRLGWDLVIVTLETTPIRIEMFHCRIKIRKK